jgi:hypothetical protein
MGQAKRERHRLKRERKRKQKSRAASERAQHAARGMRAVDAAFAADLHLRRGEVAGALEKAARAAALAPRDPQIAWLYVAAAQQAADPAEERRALEHLCRATEPDARALSRLAWLSLQAGEAARARELAARARAILPRRMPSRKAWLATLEQIEARTAAPPPERAAEKRRTSTLPLFPAEPGALAPPGASPRSATSDTSPSGPRALPAEGGEVTAELASGGTGALVPEAAAAAVASEPPAASEPPGVRLLEIPVALDLDVEGLDALANGPAEAPEKVRLAVLAAQLRDAESFDRLLATEQARGLLRLSHQEETARKVLATLLGRALLADEVGLGKTIEAGLVLSEYLLRGRIRDALVLTPPSLVDQWREELASKLGIETRTTEDPEFRADAAAFWSAPGVAVASLPTARSPRNRDLVTARTWDLVIVDEAHALKNARTESYALVSRLSSRFLLLLTATPVENRIDELYNLVSLIRPGHLGGRSAFVRRFADPKGRVTEAARREVRALLGEVMVRNTRALSGVRLPPRFARTVLVEADPAEAELYDHLATALRALGPGGRTRLILSLLLQEAGSSPHAVRATLEKLRTSPDLPPATTAALTPAIEFARRPLKTGKGAALLRALDGHRAPAVVFTRFRATLDFLAATLADRCVPYARMDGNMPAAARREAVEQARESGAVLLSTDVGSEGLNLQFCRRIVNFDLPWNPMRIEQRIGRVHRIGQEQPVDVVTLCLAGSIEERILRILDERINLFELVVGEAEMILGYLEDERDFPELMLDAFAERDAPARERSFTRIADALAAARTRYENVKRFDEAFFRNELGV